MNDQKPKRVYAKRRDYKKEMETLAVYCETAAELMIEFRDKAPEGIGSEYWDGQATALKAILARIGMKP